MEPKPPYLRTVLSQNRAEELGNDVWKHFVVPPFFEKLDLEHGRKPRLIIGGRGCGKTMLLRYLSYTSAFSPDRPVINNDALRHIGLYWRADTQFARIMTGRGLGCDVWSNAFNHLLALVLSLEIIDSVLAIRRRGVVSISDSQLQSINITELAAYGHDLNCPLEPLRSAIEQRFREFELWVGNVRKVEEPVFLPGIRFITSLISGIQTLHPAFRQASFFAYIDEYENLLEYQQKIINTALKHSVPPLILNVATKRNGLTTQLTIGDESIIDPDDYRTHDIELYLAEDFGLFAAEVLLLMLYTANWSVPVDVQKLRSPDRISEREQPEYRDEVLGVVRRFFPGLSQRDLADTVFATGSILSKLRDRIHAALALRGAHHNPQQFLREDLPQASIVASALLFRRRLTPDEILEEMNRFEAGMPNRFSSGWIHNNFIGCVLALYQSSPRICPWYAGFDTFTSLAKGNIRHFLELCHRSLADAERPRITGDFSVDIDIQAQAARHTSAAFLGQIRSFGRLGNRLHTFVLRLGSLFALAQERASQSEPEQTHFSITRGDSMLSDDDHSFLAEAVKWSVLFEERETKAKDSHSVSNLEYVLNPIYAPYFKISYRKKRRLELTTDEFLILERGDYETVTELLRIFSRRWSVDLANANPTLFSHLGEG